MLPAGLGAIFEVIGLPVKENEFLPVPEMAEERKKLLKHLDKLHGQKTYPTNYLD